MVSGWIDVHTHLNMLDRKPSEVLASAHVQGIEQVITIGTEPEDWPLVLSLAAQHPGRVFCTLGIHPHEAQKWSKEQADFVLGESHREDLVAIGEIGLDYFYSHAPKEVQLQTFAEQLDLAEQLNLPVEIHTRDAETDTVKILTSHRLSKRGLLHCFTGTWDLARKALDLDFDISISGIVTFKNAAELREVVKKIPLDRLHVETDAPFLTPVPLRGKPNEPEHMIHTARFIAELIGVDVSELQQKTRENAQKLFWRLPKSA